MKTRINKQFYGLASLVSLIMGMGTYLLFKNNNMLIFEWIPKLRIFKNIYIPIKQSIFTSILLYNFPDALWFLSGIFFLRFIWFYKIKEQNLYLLCFYLIGAIFEISQLSNMIPGTFDFLDLLFMGIGAFVESLLYKIFIKGELYEKRF